VCVVKRPAQRAMAKSKKEKSRRKKALLAMEEGKAQAESNSTSPPLRPLKEETPALRASEEDTSRLSASSEEAVLDTSLSAQGKETATVLTVLGKDSQTPAVQYLIGQAMRFLRPDRPSEQKTDDSVKPVHEEKKDESNVEVDNVEVASSSAQQEQRATTQWTVMSRGKETTSVMTLFGDVPPRSD
jgi:hypothetical protein